MDEHTAQAASNTDDIGEPGDLSTTPQRPLKAAGILFVATDGQILLMRRSGRDHAGEWAFPGGGIEEGEDAEYAARRELVEETAQKYDGPLTLWTRRIAEGVDFTTFLGRAETKFFPTLNEEHDIATWASRETALSLPLHPGAKVAIDRFTWHEFDIAKAMVAGDLVSPQRYGRVLLIALRITGTGASYRPQLNEYVWRHPEMYLTEEFVHRCYGLPVVFNHPEDGQQLDAEELHNRIAGTIFLPYIDGTDVWGIAKIIDENVALLLETKEMSTSPTVVVGGKRTKIDGSDDHVLVEGKPIIIDSVAICDLGIWDKGGPAQGVDSVTAMADSISRLDLAIDRIRNYQLSCI